ncbi:MAG: CTP synthase [Lachnospiraceae bacterium]|nr:CTP synthase [Lachnospiraceae bacterium]
MTIQIFTSEGINMEFSEFTKYFLEICGGVTLLGGTAKVIYSALKPGISLKRRVEVLEDHDKRDYEALKGIAERDALILETLITMLDSQITGNNTEQLKKTREKLIAHLAQN